MKDLHPLTRFLIPFCLLLLVSLTACQEEVGGEIGTVDTVEVVHTPISAFEWTCEREDSLQQVDTTMLTKAIQNPTGIREYFVAYLFGRYGGEGMDFSCSKEELAAYIQFKDWDLACVLVEELKEVDGYVEFRHRLDGSYEEMKLLPADTGMYVLRSGVFCEGQCEYEMSIAQYGDGTWTELRDSLLPALTWKDFMLDSTDAERVTRIEQSIQFAVGYSLPVEGSTIHAWLNEEWEFGEMQAGDRLYLNNAYNELDLNWEDGRYVIGEKRRRLEH